MREFANIITNDRAMNQLKTVFNDYNNRLIQALDIMLETNASLIWTSATVDIATKNVRDMAKTSGVEITFEKLAKTPEQFGSLLAKRVGITLYDDDARAVANRGKSLLINVMITSIEEIADACANVFIEHDARMADASVQYSG